MTRIVFLTMLVLASAGCAGSVDPTRFYVLAPASGAADAPRAAANQREVRVEISRLEGALGGDSVLAARWRIVDRSGEEIGQGASRFTEASGADYETLVAAHSRLIAALSRDIADAVRRGVQVTAR